MKLSTIQNNILRLLEENIDDPLSIQRMAEELDIGSKSTVHHHLKQLEKKGYLKRNLSNPRDYHVFRKPHNSISYLPFYGLAKCGPNGNPLEGEVKEYVPISTKLFSCDPNNTILLEAYGDSMDPKIHEGDYIIIDTSAKSSNGEMALCVLLEANIVTEVLIKKITSKKYGYSLESFNKKYDDIEVAKEDLNIIGQIAGIICPGH